jgi:stage 0 sporulation regulatory protein
MLKEINLKRDLMMKSAEVTGLTSEETIYYSQELDKLIYEYQCTFRKESQKHTESKSGIRQMLIWPKVPFNTDFVYI